jgi:uncharacterized protein with HEPN domain
VDRWRGGEAAFDHDEGASSRDPLKQIAGLRDRVTHDSFGVGLVLVWRVIERDLSVLKAVIGLL